MPVVNRETVRDAVRGRTIPEALDAMMRVVPLSRTPQVEVWPQWVDRMPWMPFRIDVVVRASEAS